MSDTRSPAAIAEDHPVILFDGVCNLCNGLVQFLIPRDPEGRFRFAPLQSAAGKALLTGHGRPTDDLDSFVLVEGDSVYERSDAAIRVAELLGWPYKGAAVCKLVPRSLRDRVYDIIAANRYDMFGKKDRCMIPDEDVSERFLG